MTYTERDFGLADISAIVRELEQMISTGQDIRIDIDFSVDMPARIDTGLLTCPECGHRFERGIQASLPGSPPKSNKSNA